jgi:hypothetical protein
MGCCHAGHTIKAMGYHQFEAEPSALGLGVKRGEPFMNDETQQPYFEE